MVDLQADKCSPIVFFLAATTSYKKKINIYQNIDLRSFFWGFIGGASFPFPVLLFADPKMFTTGIA